MNYSRFSVKIWFILNVSLNSRINGEGIFDKLSVSSWLGSLGLTTARPEVKEAPTVPTKIVHPEETIFNLAPKIQRFLDSNDFQSKENFIISPLSTVAIFGQLLIGLRGLNHKLISDLLNLKHDRRKRGVIIIQESNDTLYDYTLYHGAFHFKLMTMIRKVLSDNPEDKVSLDYVMFYQQGIDFVPHFLTNMNKVYRPALATIPIDFQDLSRSTDTINEWGNQHMEIDLANRLGEVVRPQSQSFLLHTLVIECRWQTPMQETGPEDFYVSPYQTVKVKYLRASLETAYVDHPDFTLVNIPLNHDDTYVYILLPKGDNYNIGQFSENLNSGYFQNILENYQSIKNVDIKIPDVFYQYVDIDIMKPLRNYFNDVTERRGKVHDGILKLNGAAENFNMDNLLQHVYLSITNGDRGGLPKPVSQYPTQPHSTVPTNIYPEDNSFNNPYITQQSYPTGQSPGYGEGYPVGENNINLVMSGIASQQSYSTGQSPGHNNGYSVGENNANMGMGAISSQHNTHESYSTGQSPGYGGGYTVGENNANIGMGGFTSQHNTQLSYSTGQSQGGGGYSVGENNANMGMGGISSQHNTQPSYSTGQNLGYSEGSSIGGNNINMGIGGISSQQNTQQSLPSGQNPGYGEGSSIGGNNINVGIGGISSQHSFGFYDNGPLYPAVPQSPLLISPPPGYNTQGFQYQTNIPFGSPTIPFGSYSSIDSYPKNAFSSHASIGGNMHLSTASVGQSMFLRKKRDWGAVNFEVTRPFLFIVMKEKNKIVLVWGSISNPQTLQV